MKNVFVCGKFYRRTSLLKDVKVMSYNLSFRLVRNLSAGRTPDERE